ncbi:MAG: hypothetical protein BZY88_17985 [SAR202 cluster bacterium Io17-Chloro-G9]|nr:MAG: hypothetical protein BZY88_17985 [SAR202 cluster bacterium Io17-Chloro-G9]
MGTILIIGLLVMVILILLGLIGLVYQRGKIEAKDIEPAVSKAWRESGLERSVGELTAHAKDIQETHRSVDQMLRVPKERASLGELSLEMILSDQLPPEMFGMRERVFDGKVPDAHIKSTVGLICIDSKFPLDNYRAMVESQEPGQERGFKRDFIRDVRGHLSKISDDYVCPEKGSAEFSFAYIPSEGVYYFLLTDSDTYALLHDFTRKGVQVVSPLTLSHKVELIKTGVHALKLSEEAAKVKDELLNLSRRFSAVDNEWRVLYRTHLKNAMGKADDLDEAYTKVREEFDRIANLSEENQSRIIA